MSGTRIFELGGSKAKDMGEKIVVIGRSTEEN